MKHSKILSVILSCALAVSAMSAAIPAAFAEEDSADAIIYDSTDLSESKELTEKEGTSEVPFNVFDIYNAHQEFIGEAVEPPVTVEPPPIDVELEGIDVSEFQGDINWSKVKAAGVDFAIIRAGYGRLTSQVDKKFYQNIENAQAAGIDCGVYWYSYARDVEGAYLEAEACYEIIKDYDYTFPVYFDIEDPSQTDLSTAQISGIIEAFCTRLQSKGIYVGIYSYASFLNTKVYTNVLDKYDVWVAHIGTDKPAYNRDYGAWQYSWTGRIDGISYDVDLDHCYKNYPYIISPESYIQGGQTAAATTTTTTTTTSIVTKTPVAYGVDVSFWQQDIDWQKVKAAGIDFAILRAGYGRHASQEDTKFDDNVVQAHEAGIDVGVYWYSYADTVEAAVLEAEACYEVIKDYQFEYPIYFDIEDSSIASLPAETLSAITDAFCSTLEAKGYYVGITSYTYFLTYNLLPYLFDKYDTWVAHYDTLAPSYSRSYGMWQYTSSGVVDGITTRVDLDYCYRDYPSIMECYNLNGFGRSVEEEAPDEETETTETSETEESSDETEEEPVTEAA